MRSCYLNLLVYGTLQLVRQGVRQMLLLKSIPLTGLFSIFSGAVNYGIGKSAQNARLETWKYMYIFGAILHIYL